MKNVSHVKYNNVKYAVDILRYRYCGKRITARF